MRQLSVLTILLLVINVAYSQTERHLNCGACVYNKNYNGGKGIAASSETCECVPCREKRNKEKAAKQAEVDRPKDAHCTNRFFEL